MLLLIFLFDTTTSAGVRCETEVPIKGKKRPADFLLHDWQAGRHSAVDLTVRHPLAASIPWDLRKNQLVDAEAKKNQKSVTLCNEAGIVFTSLGISTFGAFGPQGLDLLGRLFSRYAGREQEERFLGQLRQQCWERLSVHKGIGEQLSVALTRLGGVAGTLHDAPVPEHPQ